MLSASLFIHIRIPKTDERAASICELKSLKTRTQLIWLFIRQPQKVYNLTSDWNWPNLIKFSFQAPSEFHNNSLSCVEVSWVSCKKINISITSKQWVRKYFSRPTRKTDFALKKITGKMAFKFHWREYKGKSCLRS